MNSNSHRKQKTVRVWGEFKFSKFELSSRFFYRIKILSWLDAFWSYFYTWFGFLLASPKTSFGVCLSPIHFSSVGEKWMRDKWTPKDVCGEAGFLCAQVSSGNPETMELLKICNFDPKALESCENFNVSNVDYCKLVSLVRGFWFGEVKSVESVEVSPTPGLPYLYK